MCVYVCARACRGQCVYMCVCTCRGQSVCVHVELACVGGHTHACRGQRTLSAAGPWLLSSFL